MDAGVHGRGASGLCRARSRNAAQRGVSAAGVALPGSPLAGRPFSQEYPLAGLQLPKSRGSGGGCCRAALSPTPGQRVLWGLARRDGRRGGGVAVISCYTGRCSV